MDREERSMDQAQEECNMDREECNALDVMGVWSGKSLSVSELKVLGQFDNIPGTRSIHASRADVHEWTSGATETCARFRKVVRAFIELEMRSMHGSQYKKAGSAAFCESCRVLLP